MATYSIIWRNAAAKELRHLDRQDLTRIVEAAGALADDPRPAGCRKLQGSEHVYRIRIGSYRIVYEVDDESNEVIVARVRHRRDAYR